MRKIVTLSMVAAAAFAVSACKHPQPAPTDSNVADQMPKNSTDECPRTDGKPCL